MHCREFRLRLLASLDSGDLYLVSPQLVEIERTRQSVQAVIDATLSLPLSGIRQYVRSQLLDGAIDRDVIDALLGHADAGNESHNPTSSLDPIQYRRRLLPAMEVILARIGFS